MYAVLGLEFWFLPCIPNSICSWFDVRCVSLDKQCYVNKTEQEQHETPAYLKKKNKSESEFVVLKKLRRLGTLKKKNKKQALEMYLNVNKSQMIVFAMASTICNRVLLNTMGFGGC